MLQSTTTLISIYEKKLLAGGRAGGEKIFINGPERSLDYLILFVLLFCNACAKSRLASVNLLESMLFIKCFHELNFNFSAAIDCCWQTLHCYTWEIGIAFRFAVLQIFSNVSLEKRSLPVFTSNNLILSFKKWMVMDFLCPKSPVVALVTKMFALSNESNFCLLLKSRLLYNRYIFLSLSSKRTS